jgi:hypothetical protein
VTVACNRVTHGNLLNERLTVVLILDEALRPRDGTLVGRLLEGRKLWRTFFSACRRP